MRKSVQGVSYLPGQEELAAHGLASVKPCLAAKAAAPLKPRKEQELCDIGLFSDNRAQLDMLDRLK